jgi:hypothetical protein
MTFKYRIEGGRYGGEVVVGRIEEELFERLKDLEEDDLWEALWELEDETGVGWYEYDDFEHLNGAYSDGGFTVVDITEADHPYDWNESEQYLDPYHIYDREAFSTSTMNPGNAFPAGNEETIPVIAVHSAEKGSFGKKCLTLTNSLSRALLQMSVRLLRMCIMIESLSKVILIMLIPMERECTAQLEDLSRNGTTNNSPKSKLLSVSKKLWTIDIQNKIR